MDTHAAPSMARLHEFVSATSRLVERTSDEGVLLEATCELMKALVAHDDWLPDEFARPHPLHYQQYLLYCDPLDRFSVVSFVWGPGQHTPIHDHTVWGVIGVLRGAECAQPYRITERGPVANGGEQRLGIGDVEVVSPTVGDVHRVRNELDDQVTISIHLYGGNIGRIARHVFAPDSPEPKPFVSGYSNTSPAIPGIKLTNAETP